MIEHGIVGRIEQGSYAGWYLKVERDPKSGWFYIFIANNDGFGHDADGTLIPNTIGCDHYVENGESVEAQFAYEGWRVAWLPDLPLSQSGASVNRPRK